MSRVREARRFSGRAAEGDDEVAIGVVIGRQEGAGGGDRGELGVGGEEGGDHVIVLMVAERAGGVNEEATGAHERSVTMKQLALQRGGFGDGLRGGAPFEVRGASPCARAAARGVDQDSVLGAGGFAGEDADVGDAGAGGPGAEFVECGRTNIVGINATIGADQAGELEGFAAGAGAGIEPLTGG